MSTPSAKGDSPQLLRALGLKEALALHVGVMIGSGIFIVPATIAAKLGALLPILLVWTVSGLLTLFGALALAELASILPEAGGPYAYLRDSYGRVWGFLFSWNDFFINKAGSLAAISIAFATFLAYFVPELGREGVSLGLGSSGIALGFTQVTAIAVIAIVTVVNVRGVRWGGWAMNVFSLAKVVALVGLIVSVLVSGEVRLGNLLPLWPESFGPETAAAFGLAMVPALWAYDGWIDVTLTSGETENPTRNVPRALALGTVLVMALYVAANLAFALVIPIPEMSGSERIAADVAAKVLGPMGASLVILGILCSTFGSANGMALAGPRSIWVTGRDGVFAASLGRVHPRFRSPHVAIWTIGLWSAILTLTGTYEQLTAYVVFGSWIFYAMAVGSVVVLRRKMPNVPRPYHSWGYPWTAVAFLAVAGWFVFNMLVSAPRESLIGMGLLILGLPFYAFWTRSNGKILVSPRKSAGER